MMKANKEHGYEHTTIQNAFPAQQPVSPKQAIADLKEDGEEIRYQIAYLE